MKISNLLATIATLEAENASLQRRNAELDGEAEELEGRAGMDGAAIRFACDEIGRLNAENASLLKAKREVEALCDAQEKSAPSAGFGGTDAEWTLTVREIRSAYATSQPQENTP